MTARRSRAARGRRALGSALRLAKGAPRALAHLRGDLDLAFDDAAARVISVDLFGTLLVRAFGDDDASPRAWATAMASLAAREGLARAGAGEWLAARLAEQSRLRDEARGDRVDEVRQREVVRATLRRVLGREPDDEWVARAAELEVEIERERTVRFEPVARRVAAAGRAGRRVVVTSDMYLEADQLERLGRAHAIEGVARYRASSDSGDTKFSGRLFERVAREEHVSCAELVHVGDRVGADVLAAEERGVRGVRVEAAALDLAALGPPGAEAIAAARFGYDVLGPIVLGFARLVAAEARHAPSRPLVFVARDGWLLREVHRVLAGSRPDLAWPADRYLQVSRWVTLAATLDGIDVGAAREALELRRDNRGLATLIEVFGLPRDAVVEVSRRARYGDVERAITNVARDRALVALLASEPFRRVVRASMSPRRELLRAHLAELGFFHAPEVVLVDVGWRGSTQSHLVDGFGDEPTFARLAGRYLGFWDDGALAAPRHAEAKLGVLGDGRRGRTPLEGAAYEASLLLESVCRAPHATVVGHERRDGRVEAVLAASSADASAGDAREAVQRGVLAYARDAAPLVDFDDDVASVRLRAQARLARLAFFPSRSEVELAGRLTHSELGRAGAMPLDGAGRASLAKAPRAWLEGLGAPWRAAYVGRTLGRAGQLAYALAAAARIALPPAEREALRAWVLAAVKDDEAAR